MILCIISGLVGVEHIPWDLLKNTNKENVKIMNVINDIYGW